MLDAKSVTPIESAKFFGEMLTETDLVINY
jgi:hypothetical protein